MAALFQIRQRGSTVGREVVGGLTTFMAMSYILFVQPAILQHAGMRTGAVFMATCIASAAACVLMGVLADYPIALAPGMGENTFFAFTLCAAGALVWPEALALTVAVGVVFLLLSTVGLRSMLLNAIPDALKSGIAAGIGLLIALLGFEWGNFVKGHDITFLAMADVRGNHVAAITLLGLAVTVALMAFHVRGAILIGILAATAATWGAGRLWHVPGITFHGVLGLPSGLEDTAGAFVGGFAALGHKLTGTRVLEIISFGFVLLFMDMFDTVGTLVGVASRADLIRDGKLPRAERALAADAAGTVFGGCLGTSTVTSYIESVTGVASGARSGLAAVVTGACLLAALFFQPLVEMVGGGVNIAATGGPPVLRYPMIAPALIVVGAMMMRAMREVGWEDVTESVPAFLAMVAIPFTFSIATGIAIGFIAYAFGKLVTGRGRQCPALVYVFAVLFVLEYALAAATKAIR